MSEQLRKYVSVAFFAFWGGAARYWLNANFSFYGTIMGNIAGCFLLAFLTYFFLTMGITNPWLNVGLGTGFVGAFTTFSSFKLDTLKLLLAGSSLTALWYFVLSILLGFLFAVLGKRCGLFLAQRVLRR